MKKLEIKNKKGEVLKMMWFHKSEMHLAGRFATNWIAKNSAFDAGWDWAE